MHWGTAIERNRDDLLRFVGWMLTCLGVVTGRAVPRGVRLAVLRMLRAVESATRRLIVIEARGLVVPAKVAGVMPASGIKASSQPRALSFALFDPRKRFDLLRKTSRGMPAVTVFGPESIENRPLVKSAVASPQGTEAIRRRIMAARAALGDLPKQALRLARRRAKRLSGNGAAALSPMRPGWPPGYREGRRGAVQELLSDVHRLAHRVENAAFTD